MSRQETVDLFELHVGVFGLHELEPESLNELRGHDLACWCPLEDSLGNKVPCHADILLEIANG